MAVSIGKRKRQEADDDSDKDQDEGTMRERFQRAFEAKFKPLEQRKPVKTQESTEVPDEGLDDNSKSDWSGISNDEGLVEVVDHDSFLVHSEELEVHRKKAFMSFKPPTLDEQAVAFPSRPVATSQDDPVEAKNLKHDLDLQRLLKESHLLDASASRGAASARSGKSRLKALDLRLQDLGAKDFSDQRKMPQSHRKGILAKAADREETRRKTAVENGVVLEKAKGLVKAEQRRERSVGGPRVGKFRGGTLKLNSRDLRSIEGPKHNSARGHKGRR